MLFFPTVNKLASVAKEDRNNKTFFRFVSSTQPLPPQDPHNCNLLTNLTSCSTTNSVNECTNCQTKSSGSSSMRCVAINEPISVYFSETQNKQKIILHPPPAISGHNGYCINIANDEPPPCTKKRGGVLSLIETSADKYNFRCTCQNSNIFRKLDSVDCNFFNACPGRPTNAYTDEWHTFSEITCDCLPSEVFVKYHNNTSRGPACKAESFFKNTFELPPEINESYLPIRFINSTYITTYFGSIQKFKEQKPKGLVNPCHIDALTGKYIEKKFQPFVHAIRRNNSVFCQSQLKEFVTLQFYDDYLANNGGTLPNGIAQVMPANKINQFHEIRVFEQGLPHPKTGNIYPTLNGYRYALNELTASLKTLLIPLWSQPSLPFDPNPRINYIIIYNAPSAHDQNTLLTAPELSTFTAKTYGNMFAKTLLEIPDLDSATYKNNFLHYIYEGALRMSTLVFSSSNHQYNKQIDYIIHSPGDCNQYYEELFDRCSSIDMLEKLNKIPKTNLRATTSGSNIEDLLEYTIDLATNPKVISCPAPFFLDTETHNQLTPCRQSPLYTGIFEINYIKKTISSIVPHITIFQSYMTKLKQLPQFSVDFVPNTNPIMKLIVHPKIMLLQTIAESTMREFNAWNMNTPQKIQTCDEYSYVMDHKALTSRIICSSLDATYPIKYQTADVLRIDN